MTTITVEVTDEQARRLSEEAERLSLPIQELAAQRILAPWQPAEADAPNPSFEAAMDYVFQKNSELYRRLA